MEVRTTPYRLIFSGGGTGGHIFPAVAIANAFRARHPESEILFVGAEGKMEMTRVPEAGYKIIGLWISGFQRRLTLSNLLLPIKIMVSYYRSLQIVKAFRPDIVIGTGGYASGPMMLAATSNNLPCIIQEQNSFAGLTNKKAGNKVSKVCVAYDKMERYFPKSKIVLTGNPVRNEILLIEGKREKGLASFGFSKEKKTVLVIGGSLGARTINESIFAGIEKLIGGDIQLIWQTGKQYFDEYLKLMEPFKAVNIRVKEFVNEMDLAYATADVVISRSGAIAISELCIIGKPVILVPSPNVAEDHQTKNAMALVEKDAAIMISDKEAKEKLVPAVLELLYNTSRAEQLSKNIKALAKPNATEDIVNEIEKLIA